jgi:hypothetical protein
LSQALAIFGKYLGTLLSFGPRQYTILTRFAFQPPRPDAVGALVKARRAIGVEDVCVEVGTLAITELVAGIARHGQVRAVFCALAGEHAACGVGVVAAVG